MHPHKDFLRRAIGNRAPHEPMSMNHASTQAEGLRVWCPSFTTGGTVFDLAQQGRSFTLTGTVSTEPNKESLVGFVPAASGENGLLLSSSSAHPVFSSAPAEYTVVMRFRADALPAGEFRTLYYDKTSVTQEVLWQNGSTLEFYHRGAGGWTFCTGPSALVTGRVYTLAAIYKANGTIQLVVDGVPGTTTAVSGLSSPDVDGVIVGGQRASTTRSWRGWIGDFRLYARALSISEARAFYDPYTRWDLFARRSFPGLWAILSAASNTVLVVMGVVRSPGKTVTGASWTVYQTVAGAISISAKAVTGAAWTVVAVVAGGVQSAGQVVVGAAKTILATVSGALSVAGQTVVGASGSVQSVIAGAVSSTGQFVQGAARTILSVLSGAVGATGQTVTVAVGNILSVLKGAVGVVRKTVNISGSINTLVSKLTNGLVRSLRGDDI